MTDGKTPRRCGNCGGAVGATDITCPRCDALLAAYEAPAGAVAGTTAAVTPVDASTPPPAPVTTTALTPMEPPASSPVATALATTKRAADAHETDTSADTDDTWPLSSAPVSTMLAEPVDLDTLPEAAPPDLPTPTPSPAPSPPPARPAPQQVDAGPIPESAQRVREQRRERWTTQAPDKKARSKSNGVPLIVIVIAIFIFMRAAGSTAAFGTLLTFGVIAFMIWFVVQITRATGRKTTSMPRNDRWRRKR